MANSIRRSIDRGILDRIIKSQGDLCAYCLLPFGTVVETKRRGTVVQMPVGDHFIPWVADGRTVESNIVASCSQCNMIKGSIVFDSLEAARLMILPRRERTLTPYFVPYMPITRDALTWNVEYDAFLSDDAPLAA